MKKEIILEIRDAEGGSDAKLLVNDMKDIYIKSAKLNNHNWKVLEERDGFVSIWLSGDNIKSLYKNEIGSHRWQRIPPTERRGRVHTSTITVALLENNSFKEINIPQNEIKIETTRGTGNGGQHKNSTDSCVVMTHIPTGIKVVRDGRSQITNREDAAKEIKKRVNEYYRTGFINEESEFRKEQIGDGSRSDKRRTYRVKDGVVIDHITGKMVNIKEIYKGRINLLV